MLKTFAISLAVIAIPSPIHFQRFYSQVKFTRLTLNLQEINLPEYAIAGETSMEHQMTGELPASGYITVYSSESKAEYDINQSEEEGVYQFAIPANNTPSMTQNR